MKPMLRPIGFLAFLLAAVLAWGCTAEVDHPEEVPSEPHTNLNERVGQIEQPLLHGCSTPFGRHTLQNAVVSFHTADPSCPAAWYAGFDPYSWRLNTLDNILPAWGPYTCQFTSATTVSDCVTRQSFACSNGVLYDVRIEATQANYAKANVMITANEPGCQRQVLGQFPMTSLF